MVKFVFVFLAVCLVSSFTTSSAHNLGHGLGHVLDIGLSHGKSLSHNSHSHVNYVHADSHYDNTELYVALADGVFEFFAKLVRVKVEILLWLKSAIIQLLIRGFAHLRHLMIHDADFVHGIITTIAELLKTLLTNSSHLGVSNVNKIIGKAAHEFIGLGLGHGFGHY